MFRKALIFMFSIVLVFSGTTEGYARPIVGPWTARIVNAPKPAPTSPTQGKSIPLPSK